MRPEPREDRACRPRASRRSPPAGLLVDVEGVGVLHEELARAHHAEARPALVAELHLDLVEIRRQLAIALQLAARDVGDDFLVRRARGRSRGRGGP